MHSSGLDPRPDIAKWSKATFRYIVLHARRRFTGPAEPYFLGGASHPVSGVVCQSHSLALAPLRACDVKRSKESAYPIILSSLQLGILGLSIHIFHPSYLYRLIILLLLVPVLLIPIWQFHVFPPTECSYH